MEATWMLAVFGWFMVLVLSNFLGRIARLVCVAIGVLCMVPLLVRLWIAALTA